VARTTLQPSRGGIWTLARQQHGVVTRTQLLAHGFTREAIQHRVERGRLHPLHRGVYAVGRPEASQLGRWMAAVLSCGPEALLGYRSATALWGMVERVPGAIEIVVPSHVDRRRPGLRVHRQAGLVPDDRDSHELIPVTSPASTLIDYASQASREHLERAVNAADRLGRIDPEALRDTVESTPVRPGVAPLRTLLSRPDFSRTDSFLERRFLKLVRDAALPAPQTQASVNGFRVDFHWPALGLVVETDGLRYHRTPTQQSRDLKREQVHAAAGLRALRFTAAQVRYEPSEVITILRAVIERQQASSP
jgi:very-short-patch-repair endonuclease